MVGVATWLSSHILVEPILFLFTAALSLYHTVLTTGLYRKICILEFFNNTGVNCDRLSDTSWAENQVQSTTAQWHIYTSLAHLLPLLVVGPIYGSFSDSKGRKIPILVGLSGPILLIPAVMVSLSYDRLPLMWIPISIALTTGLTGSFGVAFPACYSYMSDSLSDEQHVLTTRFTIAHMISQSGAIIAGLTGSLVIAHAGFIYTLLLAESLLFVSFLFTLVWLSQTPPGKTRKNLQQPLITNESCDGPSLLDPSDPIRIEVADDEVLISLVTQPTTLTSLLGGIVKTLTRPREGHFRAYLITSIVSFSLMTTVSLGFGSILSLYQLRAPLSWTPSAIAVYGGVVNLINLVGMALGILIMRWGNFHETTAILVAMGSSLSRTVITGLSNTSWLMYIAAVGGVAGGMAMPTAQSLIGQLVDRGEIGKVYAAFQIASDVSILLSTTTINLLYSATLHLHRGFLFFVLAACLIGPIVAFLWVHFDYRHYRKQRRTVVCIGD